MKNETMCLQQTWKDIPHLKGFYQASNLGNIRSVDRIIHHSNGKEVRYTRKELSQVFNKKTGYYNVNIFQKPELVHRLVAIAFLPLVEGKFFVNHINGLRHDNRVKNLEWCTHAENIKHGYSLGNRKPLNNAGEKHPRYKTGKNVRNYDQKECFICGKDFVPFYLRVKVCSAKCRAVLAYQNRTKAQLKII